MHIFAGLRRPLKNIDAGVLTRKDSIKAKILKVVQEVYGGADVKYSDAWLRIFKCR